MKKILSHESIKVYRAKCSCCDCEFEYQDEDTEWNNSLSAKVVKCPECDTVLPHSESSSTTTRMTTESL